LQQLSNVSGCEIAYAQQFILRYFNRLCRLISFIFARIIKTKAKAKNTLNQQNQKFQRNNILK
jgi:hypothetical protein